MKRTVRAVDRQEGVLLLVEAPRQIDVAENATGAADADTNRVLDRDRLDALTLDGLHVGERAKEVTEQIDRVRTVVHEDAAAADRRVTVPAAHHIDARGENILEQ